MDQRLFRSAGSPRAPAVSCGLAKVRKTGRLPGKVKLQGMRSSPHPVNRAARVRRRRACANHRGLTT
jgi:hypothetical protein